MTILFSGASPVRRDYGRGLTAQQWARFCGRYLCAESIEKFVRTAVPGGTTLIVDSTSSYFSPLSHVSRKSKGQQQQNLEKMAGNSKGGSSKQRSRSASGMKHTSWLTRTFKKAFHYNENAEAAMAAAASEAASSKDSRTGYGEQTGGGRSASLKSSKSTGSSRGNQNRMVIPQVQVTASLTGNGNGGSTTDGESQPGSPVKSSQYNDTSLTSCDNNTRQSSQSSGRKKKHKVKWP